ncbi:MAG: STAS domain-containing protein [Pseudomonas oryzihabitans]
MNGVVRTRLPLSGPLTIYTAADSKPLLMEPLAAGVTLALELAEVDEFDSAGLQLLLLAQREARALGGGLELIDPSPAITELLELAGLTQYFSSAPTEGVAA